MTRVRTRYAPSPTGRQHIGGVRSALFAYLWAKHNNGDFLLRLEDTDKEREVPGSLEYIQECLQWIGAEYDEGPGKGGAYGPYIQSERSETYAEYAQQLIESGHAYYCFCTKERLDEMRQKQQENKEAPRYDRTCKRLSAEEVEKNLQDGVQHVVRLAVPEEEREVVVDEMIRGRLTFNTKDIDDQVLMKSDGLPTYHLANVVDDHLMEISHVIRGEEWIPSTPKHVLLYEAFGWDAPVFAHLTVFLSKGGGKMSKRHGDTEMLQFRDKGYLPDATRNFMAFLGWNPKTEEEFFSMNELIERFELGQVNKANPVFDTEKLDWMNQQYMQKLSAADMKDYMQYLVENCENQEFADRYKAFLEWFDSLGDKAEAVWESLRERSKTLLEVTEVLTVVEGASEYAPEDLVWKKSDAQTTKQILGVLIEQLENKDSFMRATLEPEMIEWIKESEWGNGDVLWPMRYALSGEQRSPSPFELAELLGKEETLARLRAAAEKL